MKAGPGVFEGWLRVSRLRAADALLIFSVGGGNLEKQREPEPGGGDPVRQDGRARK